MTEMRSSDDVCAEFLPDYRTREYATKSTIASFGRMSRSQGMGERTAFESRSTLSTISIMSGYWLIEVKVRGPALYQSTEH